MSFLQPIEFIAEKVSAHYPKSFEHVGDHVKAKRLGLGLTQAEVAEIIGVTPETVLNWEQGYITEPTLKHWPGIIRFLGYCPYVPCPNFPEQVEMWRKMNGLSIKELARIVGVDEGTLARFETNRPLRKSTKARLVARLNALINDG